MTGRFGEDVGQKGGNRGNDLDSLLLRLPARPDFRETVDSFIPPPRFRDKSFQQYVPQHPTQEAAAATLLKVGEHLAWPRGTFATRLKSLFGESRASRGLYLDGGFGVGKTHLLASLWNSVPGPKSYLSFDELMYFLGLFGIQQATASLGEHRLIAIDEWELDDPGNLKLALAFLRGVLERGVFVAVTSNTIPLELGSGRFSQKDFQAEIEELAGAFEVVPVTGNDYRKRHFEARPGTSSYLSPEEVQGWREVQGDVMRLPFQDLLDGIGRVHPIRFREATPQIGALLLDEITRIEDLATALRWVHFVDSLYVERIPVGAAGGVPLGEMFTERDRVGGYAKKLSRCLSRLEELFGDSKALASASR